MILFFRSLCFDGLFYIGTTLMSLTITPFLLFKRHYMVIIIRVWTKVVLRLLKTVVGMTYYIEGLEHLPSGPFIVASKHQSAWETIAFALFFPDPAFVLKYELFQIPFAGWVMRKLRMIAVRRGKTDQMQQVIQQARSLAAQGRPLIIFPEGTRTLPGQPSTYKKGLWFLYQRLQLPVVPVALNSGLYWPRRSWCKKPGQIRVIIGQPLLPGVTDSALFADWVEEHIEKVSSQIGQIRQRA